VEPAPELKIIFAIRFTLFYLVMDDGFFCASVAHIATALAAALRGARVQALTAVQPTFFAQS